MRKCKPRGFNSQSKSSTIDPILHIHPAALVVALVVRNVYANGNPVQGGSKIRSGQF